MDILQVILCGNVLCIVALGSLWLMHPRLQIGNGGHTGVQAEESFLHTLITNYSLINASNLTRHLPVWSFVISLAIFSVLLTVVVGS